MYEAVRAVPDGPSTVARFAVTAAAYGFNGVVVRFPAGERPAYDADRIGERYGTDVVDAVEIRAESPSEAAGYLGTYRSDTTILLVHGASTPVNRFAVEQERVDVLAQPMSGGDVTHVIARAAAENDVRLEINLSPVLRSRGGTRVRAIRDLRKLVELIAAYDAPCVVSADPSSHLELRGPRDLVAVGESVGIDGEQIEGGLREWSRIAEQNRYRSSEAFVEPGVERGRHEGVDQ